MAIRIQETVGSHSSSPFAALRRALLLLCAIAALLAAAQTFQGAEIALGQSDSGCEAIELGSLGGGEADVLTASGSWSGEDCDSRFFTNTDAHNYSFSLLEEGQVRIELTSEDGDSFLHLLASDGSRIAHDDDSGQGLDARIERDLPAGDYQIEAASAVGRDSGPADFTLTVRRPTNCGPTDLGRLEAGTGLTFSGAWTSEDCGATFREDTPAQTFRFTIAEEALVRIDLTAPVGGDPYLYLLASDGTYLYSDDDGGERRNSRVENDLAPGAYLIEATTYGDRDHAHELTDFALIIRVVDPDAFHLKAQTIVLPDTVVAGQPVVVQYRAGNTGRSDVPADLSAIVYVVTRGEFERTAAIPAAGGLWQAGASYHAGEQASNAASTEIRGLTPFEITFGRPGDAWIFLAVATYDAFGNEMDFHGIFHKLEVVSGFVFDPLSVEVDGEAYSVSAEADMYGIVTTNVTAASDPEAEIDAEVMEKAIYTAGVHTQLLDGIFQRSAIQAIPASDSEARVSNADSPSSSELLGALATWYVDTFGSSAPAESLDAGEVVIPSALEDILLSEADTAAGQFAAISAEWNGLLESVSEGEALTFEEAVVVQAQLAYAERIISPLAAAGEALRAAREAEAGWHDEAVQAMMEDLESLGACESALTLLTDALEEDGSEAPAGLSDLDAELRAVLPAYGQAIDAVICQAVAADSDNLLLLDGLSVGDSAVLLRTLGREVAEPTPPEPRTLPLRVIARLLENGRVEHGIELPNGLRILPEARHTDASLSVGRWAVSSAVQVGGDEVGMIRARRMDDGRIELAFLDVTGETLLPDVRYVPADAPVGEWLRSGEIEVPWPEE